MKVIVAGGRDFSDKEFLYKVLDGLLGKASPLKIISGGARGADTLAEQWAKDREVLLERYPADWDHYGKAAGHIRNEKMAKEGNMLIAFPGGKGTRNMIKQATENGLWVYVIKETGDETSN